MSKLAAILETTNGYDDRSHLVQEGTSDDDLLVGQNQGNDFLFGRGGNDTLVASEDKGVNGGVPDENLQSDPGTNLNQVLGEQVGVTLAPGTNSVAAPGATVANNPAVATSFNFIIGTPNSDNLEGTDGNDIMADFGGNDVINGGKGDDLVFSGAGNDSLTGASGTDTLFGGEGSDRFVWNNGDGNDAIDGGVGHDISEINGATDGDTLTLTQDDQGQAILERSNLKPFTVKSDGVEGVEVNGLASDDSFTVSDLSNTNISSVRFRGGEGNDALQGNQSTAQLDASGDVGNDALQGGLVDDTLQGGEGDDILSGFLGNDLLEGGAGLDQFVFGSSASFGQANPGIDTIKDFNAQEDKIALSKTTFASLQSGEGDGFSQSSEFAIVGSEADVANSDALIVAVRGSTSTSLFYNTNGSEVGLGVGAQFSTLEGVAGDLSANNFVLQA
ncbi:MAG: calcium-binding protein [Oculatellaceae cyanobacterium bins.114]|nr:calcium-binding protein [Oculatellaceae cyanobacterium bins.114]